VEEAGFMGAFTFKYSPRPGTPAATADDPVDEATQNDRLYRLQALIDARQAAFMHSRVGTVAEVLFERPGRVPGQLVGRSPWLMPIHVDAPAEMIGTIASVAVTGTGTNSLFGALQKPAPGPHRDAALSRPAPGTGSTEVVA
jgi:tRNA-2-methylthio-N6-dimethylallyladenosine synthase